MFLWILLVGCVGTAVALHGKRGCRHADAQQEAGRQDEQQQLRRAPAALLQRLVWCHRKRDTEQGRVRRQSHLSLKVQI